MRTSDGAPVPCQHEVSVRRPDGSPRWAHLVFVNRPGVAEYVLEYGAPPDSGSPGVAPPLSVLDGDGEITVRTGAVSCSNNDRAEEPSFRTSTRSPAPAPTRSTATRVSAEAGGESVEPDSVAASNGCTRSSFLPS